MSQRKMIIFLASAALVLAITVSVGIYAATEDKDLTLVSVDYVENALKPWVKEQVSAGNGIYEVAYLTKGQKLLPQGSAEIVLRSARPFRFPLSRAGAFRPHGGQGII